ncbi:TonB-dependent receptor plug domain-containing protein, partial [Faecalibacillus intestinalis]
ADELKGLSTTDAAAALQGKASGVQILNGSGKPGQGASIRVRGYSSNSNNIGPLLIVDGLQVSSIQYLDPSMIESM